MMPGLTGLEVTRQLSKHSPKTSIVILSMYANSRMFWRRWQMVPPLTCSKIPIRQISFTRYARWLPAGVT